MTLKEIREQIAAKKSLLNDTDYQALKSLEKLLACTSTAELLRAIASVGDDIKAVIRQRQEWRDEINRMEALEHDADAEDFIE